MNVGSEPKSTIWLNRFAWFTAFATLLLICSGGMVTSKGVGLAVPDWPTTFGYNMFLFPASKWIGGIFFEHTHRLIASTVGFLTIILAVWLWFLDPRRWVRILGIAAVGAVILQGVLGGLRVTMLKDSDFIFQHRHAQTTENTLQDDGADGSHAEETNPTAWKNEPKPPRQENYKKTEGESD